MTTLDRDVVLDLTRRVLADLGPDAPDWQPVDATPDGTDWRVDLGPCAVVLQLGFARETTLRTFAEHLQDHALESAGSWGTPLPPCPRHPSHPLSPREDGGVAAWWCPADDVQVREIPGW